jgi:hypothetical protein
MDMVSAWAAKGAAAMARSEAKTIAVLRMVMAVSLGFECYGGFRLLPGVSVVPGRIVRTFMFVTGRPRLRMQGKIF